MKILFVISSLQCGGAERVCSMIANLLAKEKKECNIRILSLTNDRIFFKVGEKVDLKALNHNSNHNSFLKPFNIIQLIKNIRGEFKTYEPELIVSFMTKINIFSIIASALLKYKLVISEHTVHDVSSTKVNVIRKILYPFADYLTVLSEYDKKYYNKFCKNVYIIPNPNPLSFASSPFKINERDKIILGVGRLHPIKGFDRLVKAFSIISDKYKEWNIFIIGSGGEKENLEVLIRQYNLEERIFLKGSISNIQSIYDNAQVFALTSHYEGFGIALVESMSRGLACISFDISAGPREIIENNVDGILVENNNIKLFSTKLAELIENEKLRSKLSLNAVNKAKLFHEDEIISKWLKFIEFVNS